MDPATEKNTRDKKLTALVVAERCLQGRGISVKLSPSLVVRRGEPALTGRYGLCNLPRGVALCAVRVAVVRLIVGVMPRPFWCLIVRYPEESVPSDVKPILLVDSDTKSRRVLEVSFQIRLIR